MEHYSKPKAEIEDLLEDSQQKITYAFITPTIKEILNNKPLEYSNLIKTFFNDDTIYIMENFIHEKLYSGIVEIENDNHKFNKFNFRVVEELIMKKIEKQLTLKEVKTLEDIYNLLNEIIQEGKQLSYEKIYNEYVNTTKLSHIGNGIMRPRSVYNDAT